MNLGGNLRTVLAISLTMASFAAFGQASSPQASCDRAKQVGKSSAQALPVQSVTPIPPDVAVYCGTNGIYGAALASASGPKSDAELGTNWVRVLEALFKLLSSLAWPLAAYLIARHFRAELAALLARLKRLKAGSAEAEFERGVDEVSQETEIAPVDQEPDVSAHSVSVAAADPRGSILGAWLEVEGPIPAS